MAKYHVKKDGTPGICRAQDGNCPLGDTNEHFSNVQDAQEYADKLNEQRIKRDKLGKDYIRNTYFGYEVDKIVYDVLDSMPKVISGAPSVKYRKDEEQVTITDKGIRVTLPIDVAACYLSRPYPNYVKSDVNLYFDLDNINKIKIEVDDNNKGLYRHTILTSMGDDFRSLGDDEEEVLKNYENKIKNKLSKKKKEITELIYGGRTDYVYDDLNKFNGKEVKETINSIHEDLYYEVISEKDNKLISEGRLWDGDFEDNILKSKVKGLNVKDPGDFQYEIVQIYI